MNTIILEQPERLALADSDPPQSAAPGQAIVRVRRVGVCGTDYHAYRGRQPFFSYPRILGHELGVEVVEVAENESGIRPGDRCAAEPYLNCGNCIACRLGKTNCCESLQVLGVHVDGGMRELIRVPVHKLHRSESLSLDQLALVETLGIGAHAVARAQLMENECALIIGAGPIGLSVVQFATIAGAQVIVLDVSEDRLASCSTLFPTAAVVPVGPDSVEAIRSKTGGELPLAVFDATGNAESMMGSFQYAAPGGRVVFVGLVLADITFHDPDFHRKELTLLATRNSTGADFRRIISLMEASKVDTTRWITHRCPAGSIVEEFPRWLDPQNRVLKAIVDF